MKVTYTNGYIYRISLELTDEELRSIYCDKYQEYITQLLSNGYIIGKIINFQLPYKTFAALEGTECYTSDATVFTFSADTELNATQIGILQYITHQAAEKVMKLLRRPDENQK